MFNQELDQNNQPIPDSPLIDADLLRPVRKTAPTPRAVNPFPIEVDNASQATLAAPLDQFDNGLPSDEAARSNEIISEQQSGLAQAGNALARGIFGELVGGTIQTIGALADPVATAMFGSEKSLGDIIYDGGKAIQDATNQEFPIYSNDRFDPGWWWSGASSTMSVLSTMLPGLAVAKGADALGKLAKVSAAARALLAENASTLVMRHAENYREAEAVKKQVYERAMNQGLGEDLSTQKAADAASLDYQMNAVNYIFDLAQMSSILGGLKVPTRNEGMLNPMVAAALGRDPNTLKYYAQKAAKNVALASSEGVEEMVNEISAMHSQREDGKSMQDSIGDYLGAPNVWDSFIWGTAGGALFEGVGHVLGKEARTGLQTKLADIADRSQGIKSLAVELEKAGTDEVKRTAAIDKMKYDYAISAVKSGNVDLALEQLSDPKALQDAGIAEKIDPKELTDLKDTVEWAERRYKSYSAPFKGRKYENYLQDTAVGLEFEANQELKRAEGYDKAIAQYAKDLKVDKLSPVAQQYLKTTYDEVAITANLKYLEDKLATMEKTDPEYNLTQDLIAQHKEELKIVTKTKEDLSTTFSTPQEFEIGNPVKVSSLEQLDTMLSNRFNDEVAIAHVNKRMAYNKRAFNLEGINHLQSKEGQDEFEKYINNQVEKNNQRAKAIVKAKKTAEKTAKATASKAAAKEKVTANNVAATNVATATPETAPVPAQKTSEEHLKELIELLKGNESPDPTPGSAEYRARILEVFNNLMMSLEKDGIDIMNPIAVGKWIAKTVGDVQFTTLWPQILNLYNGTGGTQHVLSAADVLGTNITAGEKGSTEADQVREGITLDEGFSGVKTSEIIKGNTEAVIAANTASNAAVRNPDDARIIPAASAIAWLNKEYKVVIEPDGTESLKTAVKELLPTLRDPRMALPEFYLPGTVLTLEVDKGYNVDGVTYADLAKKEIDGNHPHWHVPIAVKFEGNIVGYIHDMDWIIPYNVVERLGDGSDNISLQRDLLFNLRQDIVNNGSKDVTVDFKGNGWIEHHNPEDVTSFQSVEQAFPDPNIQFGISKKGMIYLDRDQMFKDTLLNREIAQDGVVHAIVPMANGTKIALRMNTVKVGKEYASDIVSALDAFIKRASTNVEEATAAEAVRESIRVASGNTINIFTAKGLQDYIEQITYTFNLNAEESAIIANPTEPTTATKKYIAIRSNGVDFQETNGKKYGITDSTFANDRNMYDQLLKRLEAHLSDMYVKISLDQMGKGLSTPYMLVQRNADGEWIGKRSTYRDFIKAHTTTNLNSTPVTLPNGVTRYIYAFQPVITFATSTASTQIATSPTETTQSASAEPKVKKALPKLNLGQVDGDESFDPTFDPEAVQYALKASSLITTALPDVTKWAKQLGGLTDQFWTKVQQKLQVPKDQIELLRNSEGNTIEDKLINFTAAYTHVVKISISKSNISTGYEFDEDGHYINNSGDILSSEQNTEHYAKLSATQEYANNPDWDYQELEFTTPLITPSITGEGHAQFSTRNGIGWARIWYNKKTGEVHVQEVQSDLFQKGRDREYLVDNYKHTPGDRNFNVTYEGKEYKVGTMGGMQRVVIYKTLEGQVHYENPKQDWLTQEEIPQGLKDIVSNKFNSLKQEVLTQNKSNKENQFLQLLNKDNNWVTFFIKSIIQDSAKKGYKKVLFPSGDTASKVEGHTTLEEFKKQKENRIKELENKLDKYQDIKYVKTVVDNERENGDFGGLEEGDVEYDVNYTKAQTNLIEKTHNEINALNKELERVEREGFAALRPIYKFYEETAYNILKKNYQVTKFTDEYGNTWNEVNLDNDSLNNIFLSFDPTPQEVSFADSQYLIDPENFDGYKQNVVINVMMTHVLNELKSAKKELSIEKVFGELKGILQQYADDEDHKANFEPIIKNFDAFKEASINKMAELQFISISKRFKDEIRLTTDDLDSGEERFDHNDERSLMEDPKDSMSGRFRLFFTSIPSGEASYLGESFPLYKDFDEIVNFLHTELNGIEPDFDKMLLALTQSVNKQPWVSNLIRRLKNADQQIKNEFAVNMFKQYAKHEMALWTKRRNQDGDVIYVNRMTDSDRTSKVQVLYKSWYSNLKTSKIVIERNGELFISKAAIKYLSDSYADVQLQTEANNLVPLQNWLKYMGIEMSIESLQELYNNPYKYFKMPLPALFNNVGGVFHTIKSRLTSNESGDSEDTLALNNPLINNSGVMALARIEAGYNPTLFATSMKNADGNQIYPYTQPTFLSDRVLKLLNSPVLIDQLNKSPFSKTSTWLKELSKDESYMKEVFSLSYVDGINKIGAGDQGTRLVDMSPREHEIYKIGACFNSGLGRRNQKVAKFFMPTFSDKTRMALVQAVKHNTGVFFTNPNIDQIDGLSAETMDSIFSIVQAEINRIVYHQTRPSTLPEYSTGSTKFIMIPFLNDVEDLWLDGKLLDSPENINKMRSLVEAFVIESIQAKKREWQNMGIIEKQTIITAGVKRTVAMPVFIDNTYIKEVAMKNVENTTHLATYVAADFVVNNMIALGNMFQLIVGDPALYWKKDITETYANIGKRLAAMIAPGHSLANSWKESFNYVFLRDNKSSSNTFKEIKAILDPLGLDASAYGDIESTDAQEYTTLKEHLTVLERLGRISQAQMTTLLANANAEKLSSAELKLVLQPIKPVYTNSLWDDEDNTHRVLYVKSSSFPLIPQLTKGLELDKLRQAMESEGIDRVAYKTAVKVGNSKLVDIFDATDNQKFKSAEDIKALFKVSIHSVPRDGFRIQQEVPYDPEKAEVTKGSQETKLLFLDILGLKDFDVKGEKFDTGALLKEHYEALHKDLYRLKYEALLEKLTDNSVLNIAKLRDMMVDEAKSRGMSKYDIDSLATLKDDILGEMFILPVWGHPLADKFESLLISIVNKGVVKQKMPGKSYVLGSEAGFREAEGDVTDVAKGVVWAPGYDPKQGLRAQTLDKPSQVIAPFKFRDNTGKLLNVKDFVDASGRLDTSKIPKELLQMFSFRIPTQGHNSMAWIEIVGFLPEESGDLIITPRDFTKQMGSDFDVDKLYSYVYNTRAIIDEDRLEYLYAMAKDAKALLVTPEMKSALKALNESYSAAYKARDLDKMKEVELVREDIMDSIPALKEIKDEIAMVKRTVLGIERDDSDPVKALQNSIIDVHFAVMQHPEALPNILSPLGFGNLHEMAERATSERAKRSSKKTQQSLVLESYYKDKYLNGTVGKAMTGIKSLDSTLNATIQGKDMYFITRDGEETEPAYIVFGEHKLTDLSGVKAIDGKNKSYHIAAYQSAAVDNEKELILGRINSNKITASAERAILQVGFTTDHSASFISQNILLEYVEEMKRMSDSTTDGSSTGADLKVFEILNKRYREAGKIEEGFQPDIDYPFEPEQMWTMIGEGKNFPDYHKMQLNILAKFMYITELGDALGDLQRAINTDSAGLGKNFIETNNKEGDVIRHVYRNRSVAGSDGAIGKVTFDEGVVTVEHTTINGFAIEYGLQPNNRIFNGIFPTNTFAVNALYQEIENQLGYTGNRSRSLNAEDKKVMWDAMKSYMFANNKFWEATEGMGPMRDSLLFDVFVNLAGGERVNTSPSLATRVLEFSKTTKGKRNAFISKLEFDINSDGKMPSMIYFASEKGENSDESNTYQGMLDLLNDPETAEMADDLILYAYMNGGIQKARNFVRYIPPSYLMKLGMAKYLRSINFNSFEDFGLITPMSQFDVSPIVQQIIQHMPNKAIRVESLKTLMEYIAQGETLAKDDVGNPILFTLPEIPSDAAARLELPTNNLLITKKFGNVSIDGYPNFISVFDASKLRKYRLYKLVPSDKGNMYMEMSTLGGPYNFNEYEPGFAYIESVIPENRSKGIEAYEALEIKELAVKNVVPVTTPKEYMDKYVLSTLEQDKEYSKDVIFKMLDSIVDQSNDTDTKFNAMYLQDALAALYADKPLTIKLVKSPMFVGRFSYEGDTNLVQFDLGKLKNYSEHEMHEIVIHELLHAVSSRAINELEAEFTTGKANPLYTDAQRTAYGRMRSILRDAESKVKSGAYEQYGLSKEGLDRWRELYTKIRNNPTSATAAEIAEAKELKKLYYAFTNPAEFLANTQAHGTMRAVFNQIPYAGSNLLDVLMSWLTKVLTSFGFVKEGTLLDESMKTFLGIVGVDISDSTPTALDRTDYVNHSGGAQGADLAWDEIGREFGVTDHRHYRPEDLTNASASTKAAIEKAVTNAAKGLGRPTSEFNGKDLVRRNWFQVNGADEIFAVAPIIEAGEKDSRGFVNKAGKQVVSGGTGWAVEMAIQQNKPVHVYDENRGSWFTWQGNAFVAEDTPVLTKNFAGIGSRGITNKGRQAITNVYGKTMNGPSSASLKPAVQPSPIQNNYWDTLPKGPNGRYDLGKFEANQEQHDTLVEMFKWIYEGTEPTLTLSGYAGTGKSTMIKFLLDNAKLPGKDLFGDQPVRAIVTATTHKAKNNIRRLTKRVASTLHSILGLKPNALLENFKPSDIIFSKTRKAALDTDLIVIDEASMINDDLYKHAIDSIRGRGTKILFIGDPAQLPPIGSTASKVFSDPRNVNLTIVERTAMGNPLIAIFTAIRDGLKVLNPIGRHSTQLNSKGEGVQYFNGYGPMYDSAIALFTHPEYASENNLDFVKILAFTNKAVQTHNNTMRYRLLGEKAKTDFNVGEPVMAYYTIQEESEVEGEKAEPLFNNSMDYIIVDRQAIPGGIELTLTDPSEDSKGELKTVTVLDMNDTAAVEMYKSKYAILVTAYNKAKYEKAPASVITGAFEDLEFFRNEILVPVDIEVNVFNFWQNRMGIETSKKQIDYGYAVTIHKSQGSTYTHVFVDEKDIDKAAGIRDEQGRIFEGEDTNKLRNQLKYVAYSRAAKYAGVYYPGSTEANTYEEPQSDMSIDVDTKFQPLINKLAERERVLLDRLTKAKLAKDVNKEALVKNDLTLLHMRMETLTVDRYIDEVNNIGSYELEEVARRLNSAASEDELNYLLEVIALWKDSTRILKNDIDLTSIGGDYSSQTESLMALQSQAVVLYGKWLDLAQAKMLSVAQAKSGIQYAIDDVFGPTKDISMLTANHMDVTRTDKPLLSTVGVAMHEAAFDTTEEYNEFAESLRNKMNAFYETPEYKANKFDKFLQEDADGNRTGYMIHPFSHKFFSDRAMFTRAVFRPKSSARDWTAFRTFKRNHVLTFDPRKLFYSKYKALQGGRVYDKVAIDAHENELIALMGNSLYNRELAKVRDLIDKYELDFHAEQARIATLAYLPSEQEALLRNWEKLNSPFQYMEWLETEDIMALAEWGTRVPFGSRYTSEVPMKIVKGTDVETNYWDTKYQQIEQDPVQLATYEFLYDSFNKYRDYLPEYLTDGMQDNFIPELQKKLVEEFSENGAKAWMVGLSDKLIEAVTQKVGGNYSRAILDPITGKERPNFQLRMLGREMETEDKSYDLPYVLDTFARQSIMFAHKVKIQDMLYLSNSLLQGVKELKTAPNGNPTRSTVTQDPIAVEGLVHTKAMLDYAIKAFHGNKRLVEGATTKKIKNSKDKKKARAINDKLAQMQADLEAGKVKNHTRHNEEVAKLEAQLEALGANFVWGRLGDTVLQYMQLKGMGWNVFSGINNIAWGVLSNIMQAAGQEDYTLTSYFKAQGLMLSTVFSPWARGQVDRLAIGNKIANLMHRFDVLKEVNEANYSSFTENNPAAGTAKKFAPYEIQRRGEYFIQGSSFVAYLLEQKVTDLQGVEHSMLDAFTEQGEWNEAEYGPSPDLRKMKIKMDQLIKRVHGNYDPNSPVRIKQWWIGRALMQFRSWISEGFASRFEGSKQDLLLGREVKGRWVTYYDLGWLNSLKTVSKQAFDMITLGKTKVGESKFNGMSTIDVANMRKNFAEIMMIASLMALYMLLKGALDDEDDDEAKKKMRYSLNMLFRLQNDAMFYISPSSFESITQNALPVFKIAIDLDKWVTAVGRAIVGDDEIKTGAYAHESRLERTTMKLIPGATQILNVETAAKRLQK